jgi:hypothetical protein
MAKEKWLSRRHFYLCCVGSTAFAVTGSWLTSRQVSAEAQSMVDTVRSAPAIAPPPCRSLRRAGATCVPSQTSCFAQPA